MSNLEIRNNLNKNSISKLTSPSIEEYLSGNPDAKPDNIRDTEEEDSDEVATSVPLLTLPRGRGRNRTFSEDDNTEKLLERIGRLTEPDTNTNKPPLAGPEIDDLDEPDSDTTRPTLGIDDGFLTPKPDFGVEDVEKPRVPSPGIDDGFLTPNPRPETDDDSDREKPTTPRTRPSSPAPSLPPDKPPTYPYPVFPYAPGYGPGVINSLPPELYPNGVLGIDGVITLPNGQRVPDVNVYQHKKTLAQGMMDLALFSANANQLRYVLESQSNHPYYLSSIFLISISLFLQVAVGAGLIWNSRYNIMDQKQIHIANKINNFTIIGIFFITIVNVFISAFGVAPPR